MVRILIATAALMTAAMGAAWAQDVEKGATSFKKCAICHRIGPGATNLVGPVLNGLDGRKSGTWEGYSYSDNVKNAGITWNEAQFKEYVENPQMKIPGTRMAFVGLKDAKDRNDVWAYLNQFDKDGKKK